MASPTAAVQHGTDLAHTTDWFWGKLGWDIFPFYDPSLGYAVVRINYGQAGGLYAKYDVGSTTPDEVYEFDQNGSN